MSVAVSTPPFKPTRHNRRYDPRWAWLRHHVVGVWPCWERGAKQLANLSRLSAPGTINFGVGEDWADMQYGPGLHFANNGYATTGVRRIGGVGLFAASTEQWTIAVRARVVNNTNSTIIGRAENTLANRTFWLRHNRPGSSNSTPTVTLRGTTTGTAWQLDDDQWHIYFVTWDGVTGLAYYDEARGVTTIPVGAAAENTTEEILLGARTTPGPTDLLDGDIDFVAILDIALRPGEIARWARDIYAPWRPDQRLRRIGPEAALNIHGDAAVALTLGVTAAGGGATAGSGFVALDFRLLAEGQNAAAPGEVLTMAELQATILATISGPYERPRGLGKVAYTLDYKARHDLGSGSALGEANVAYQSAPGGRVLAAGASEQLDMTGPLIDAIGDPLTQDHVKALLLYAHPTNQDDLVVGGAAANAWQAWFGTLAGTERVAPGGILLRTHPGAGWVVTPGTGDQFKVLNASGTDPATYDIIVIGSNASA